MWTSEWPTEPGYYWTFGYQSYMRMGDPKLELAQAKFYGSGKYRKVLYTYRGGFMDKEEALVLWSPAETPALPTTEELVAIPDPREDRK